MSAATPCRTCARGDHHACMGWCSCSHAKPARTSTPARRRQPAKPRPARPVELARPAVPVTSIATLPDWLPLDERVAAVRLLRANPAFVPPVPVATLPDSLPLGWRSAAVELQRAKRPSPQALRLLADVLANLAEPQSNRVAS